ncbi:dTDP-4-dehydrorhamnose 3,5-epimerase family protein [Candidatus Curtissbacteria bacterium]|nr:dTDP-4-dehydrorhamnose 3,5-epimerase family protein [Candidatus Curtissbacteria bacterium]
MKKATNSATFFKPRVHDDDRRRGTFDVFHTPTGDINYSYIYPNAIAAWHKHKKQTDYWHVIKGALKVGLYDQVRDKLQWVYLHESERQTLAIPPGIWHGWRNISAGETILSYYITQKYDEKNPDEDRAPVGAFGENWETEAK